MLTLGKLRDAISNYIENSSAKERESLRVMFDFCGYYPDEFNSWRGDYSQAMLGYHDKYYDAPLATAFLESIKVSIGATYTGYKGGEFTMSEYTPVWIDRWGEYNHTVIDKVSYESGWLVLHTKYHEY